MNTKNQIVIAIVCVILGIILSLQYKVFRESLEGTSGNLLKKQSELSNELEKVMKEKKVLVSKLKETEKKLNEIEESASRDNAVIKNLSDTIDKYEILAGMSNVVGEGVEITIDNPPLDQQVNDVNIINSYEEILKLVNELNAAGAEAISINEQRVIGITEIRKAGNFINVNSIPQTNPLIIKAIGNKSSLEGALSFRYGQVTNLRRLGILVDIRTLNEVKIPSYIGKINFKYASTIEE